MDKLKSFHILKPGRCKIKIQRSTFIGSVTPVLDIQEADSFREKIKKEFYKATHNCFAYRINQDQFRFSDDGEPAGTAGRPILTVLEKYNLEQTAMVVTRYFGGTKLGKGGLSRAYAQCTEETILEAGVKEFIPQYKIKLAYPYSFTNQIENIIKKHSGKIISGDFNTEVKTSIQVPKALYDQFLEEVISLNSDQVKIIEGR